VVDDLGAASGGEHDWASAGLWLRDLRQMMRRVLKTKYMGTQ
jgi:hypothetical protein